MLKIRRITYASPDYDAEVRLRDEILRKPLGLKFHPDDLAQEADNMHFGAFLDGELVGTVQLAVLSSSLLKMRQVAVSKHLQRNGIGRALVQATESFARENSFERIVLHARLDAVPFYLKLSYEVSGEEFMEVGIPHRKMQKTLV